MIARSPVKPTKPPSSGIPPRRVSNTPLRSVPATGTTSILTSTTATGSTTTPHEAMVASQLAHISDLVQKNRSLEQTIKKLNEDLAKSAADVAALNIDRKSWEADRKTWTSERQKWMDERKVWVEGCDTMQACHHIQHYRVACALHDERVAVLKMQEMARQEQLRRLQRDHKITMFQVREAELEAHIGQLEDFRDEAVEASALHEKSTQELQTRSAALANEVKLKTAEVRAAHQQREKVEGDLGRLREAHANATAASTATSSEVTRLTTERDALAVQITSLRRSLEVTRTDNTQLQTQLANWQNLKKGEDAAAEGLRKKSANLEQELSEAKRRISELESRTGQAEKYKVRVEKLKANLEQWKASDEENRKNQEALQAELTDANAQVTALKQKILKLEAQLSIASESKSSNKKPPRLPESAQSDEGPSEPSTSTLPAKAKKKPSSKLKPSSSRPADVPTQSRRKPSANEFQRISEDDSSIEILGTPPVSPRAPQKSAKAKGKLKAIHYDDEGSEDEVRGAQKLKKGKARDIEAGSESREPKKVKQVKPKKASPPREDTAETHSKHKAKPNPKKRTSPDHPPKSKSKPTEADDDAAAAETDAPKKKKRKINLFGGSQPAPALDWEIGQPTDGLGIPRELSPIKTTEGQATQAVPRRLGRANK